MTPVYKYWHEYEPVGLTLITVFHDIVYGVMPPLCIIVYATHFKYEKTI